MADDKHCVDYGETKRGDADCWYAYYRAIQDARGMAWI